jgi:purine-binding chemotaxis protein CheW
MAIGSDFHGVGFRIGTETFAVPIALVREIVRVPEITAVPEAPACVEGVINLRGRIIPVLDLRKRFGEPIVSAPKKNRILVTEVAGKLVGLIVDAASEVLKIPLAEIEDAPQGLEDGGLNYIMGMGKLAGRLIILINLSKLLQNNGEQLSLSRSKGTGSKEDRSAVGAAGK